MALSSLLVNPQFLFRIERDPAGIAPGTAYRNQRRGVGLAPVVLPVEQHAGRRAARSGRPRRAEPARRARTAGAADAGRRAFAVAGQQLCRAVALSSQSGIGHSRHALFPDFDDNLRQALRQETELFFESILREDRSVLDLIKADYTYLNERLAKHYGIPHVYGSRFRRVALDEASHRGGLLRQGSILTVTSYATRTSPVIRGHWVLKNLLGTPPPPPPPNVPALDGQYRLEPRFPCASG